ncbi:hypothetical protein ACIBCD_15090 [Nocardia brasiliensis]
MVTVVFEALAVGCVVVTGLLSVTAVAMALRQDASPDGRREDPLSRGKRA